MGYLNNKLPKTKRDAAEYICPASLPPLARQEWIAAVIDSADEQSIIEKAQTNFVANNIGQYISFIGRLFDNHGVKWNEETVNMDAISLIVRASRPNDPLASYQMDNGDIIKHLFIQLPDDEPSKRFYKMLESRFLQTNSNNFRCAWFDLEKRTIRFQILPAVTLQHMEMIWNIASWCYTIFPYK